MSKLILQGVIENLLDNALDDHIREAAYEALVPVLLDAGVPDLDDCCGGDPVLDRVLRIEQSERS